MKNIDLAKMLIKQNEKLFLCPVCTKPMRLNNGKSLICKNKHCFDLSKTGYINLLLNTVNTHYDKKLFEARNKICKQGIYDHMLDKISTVIDTYHDFNESNVNVLDVGCGEGSHLANIIWNFKK